MRDVLTILMFLGGWMLAGLIGSWLASYWFRWVRGDFDKHTDGPRSSRS